MKGWDGFSQYVTFDVWLGNRFRFWHDKWCGDRPLKERFLALFMCSMPRDATVESMLSCLSDGMGWEWNVHFTWRFND